MQSYRNLAKSSHSQPRCAPVVVEQAVGAWTACQHTSAGRHIQRPRRSLPSTAWTQPMVRLHGAVPAHRINRVQAVASAKPAGVSDKVQVSCEKVSQIGRKLRVIIPGPLVHQSFVDTVAKLKEIMQKAQTEQPSAKASLAQVIDSCGGQSAFKAACVEGMLMTVVPEAMQQVTEPVLQGSERIVTTLDQLLAAYDPSKPLTVHIEFDVRPVITWERSYKDIAVTIRDTGNHQTDVEATEDLIRQYLKEKGGQQQVVGRGLQQGDVAVVDFEFRLDGTRELMPGLTRRNRPFDTEMDSLGITQHLLGARVGEQRKFTVTFPEDIQVELWRGLPADVCATVQQLHERVLPQFDDDFVKAHHPQYGSAEEMRNKLLAATSMERITHLDKLLEEAIVDEVVRVMEVDALPESLVTEIGTSQYKEALSRMANEQDADKAQLEKLDTDAMTKEYIEAKRPDLEKIVKFNLAIEEIFAAEGLEVSNEEVKQEADSALQSLKEQGVEPEPDDEAELLAQAHAALKRFKVVEWLKDNVKREVIPWQGEAAAGQRKA